MSINTLIDKLKSKSEMTPDEHDGSYELMRSIVSAYASLQDFSSCNYADLDAIYAMAIGTWQLNVEKKRDYVKKTCLPVDEQNKVIETINKVWDNACRSKYSNKADETKPTIGMFGTGFYTFDKLTSDLDCPSFIKMLTELLGVQNDNELFGLVEPVFEKPSKGIGTGAASVILHCLKPYTFPIMNRNMGHTNIFSAMGIPLKKPTELNTYIDNCRMIKAFRDDNFRFKNYRIFDIEARNISEDDLKIVGEQKMGENTFDNNIILYGPPGTGKTYNTVAYAVAIIEGKTLDEVKAEDYATVKKRYEDYKSSGQIAFTTFHQSYGYEEFIEGIKPNVNEDNEEGLDYSVEPGVFKAFCDKALVSLSSNDDNYGLNKSPVVWKVSLEKTFDNPTRRECLENGHIRIGWDQYGKDIVEDMDFFAGGKNELNAFINKMRIGDIIFSCYSASTIDAIGVVTGEYEWHDEYEKYKRVRSVKWLVKGISEEITDLNGGKNMTLSSVYRLRVDATDALKIVEKYDAGEYDELNQKNYVFIIDEINRGNISKIFGELITLIEQTKRIGAEEEMTISLPYSPNKTFGVPKNVYILGTMNTADRSIAMMDTALRRRFSFEEMMPESDVLRKINANQVVQDGETLDVAAMLDVINKRIEYLYDREHTIGHAFFTGLKNEPTIDKLASIFEKSVIPLLQEYFYEDYSKIQLVLGDNNKTGENKQYQFIRDDKLDVNDIFNGMPEVDLPENKYSIQKSAFRKLKSYKLIGKGL